MRFPLWIALVAACAPVASSPGAERGPARETFFPLPKATLDTRKAELSRRTNGVFFAYDVSPFSGMLTAAHRATEPGAARDVTAAEAEATARTFAEQQGELFGFVLADLARATVRVTRYEPISGHTAYDVVFGAVVTQPGYEGFPSIAQDSHLVVDIADDGQPIHVIASTVDCPKLHVRTRGLLAPSDPRVTASVIGQPLYAYDDVGPGPASFVHRFEKRFVRNVTSSDHFEVTPFIFATSGIDPKTGEISSNTFEFGYSIHIPSPPVVPGKTLMSWTYFVDADTGRLVHSPPSP